MGVSNDRSLDELQVGIAWHAVLNAHVDMGHACGRQYRTCWVWRRNRVSGNKTDGMLLVL